MYNLNLYLFHSVSVRKSGPGEIVPEGAYVVTGNDGETHIVSTGQFKVSTEVTRDSAPYSIVPAFKRSTDGIHIIKCLYDMNKFL